MKHISSAFDFNIARRILLFFAAGFLLAGCSTGFSQNQNYFTNEEKIEFSLPDWNRLKNDFSQMPSLACWKIEYTTYKGSNTFFAEPATKTFRIEVPKNYPCAVQAFPLTLHDGQKSSFYHPCGAIYPQNKGELLWQQGFASEILSLIYKNSGFSKETAEFASLFNWQNFIEKIAQKEEKSISEIKNIIPEMIVNSTGTTNSGQNIPPFYNPWLLDKKSILQAIAEKSFNAYKLNLASATSLCAQDEIFQILGGTKYVFSPYIPENYILEKFNFMTIIKRKENPSKFLWKNFIAEISVNSSGKAKLNLCAIPGQYEEL